MSRPALSIIIPTYNALPELANCLAALVSGLSAGLVREAIVVDGSSTDDSAHLAADMGCTTIIMAPNARGRGAQLSAGAQASKGSWLLFLHADTVLHENWVSVVHSHIAKAPAKAAFFKLAFQQSGRGPRRVAALANWRERTFGLPYGDQGLLISRELYDQVGGFAQLTLMEDVDFVVRLGRRRLIGLECVACTSGAKYEHGGWWALPLRNLMLLGAFLMGVKPAILAKWYR